MFENLSLHETIDRQAAADPLAVAVEQDGEKMQRGELKRLSDALALQLINRGVGPDTIVAVVMERSFEMVVAIVGILKSRGAYLPIDPGFPSDRLAFLLNDAKPAIVLTDSTGHGRVTEKMGIPTWQLVLNKLHLPSTSLSAPASLPVAEPENLAYVIYTSGSTGKPKGCLLEHRALCNRIGWMQKAYPIGVDDAVLQKTPYTFDVSVWEFLWPLVTGARMVLAGPQGHRDNRYLKRCIDNSGVTVCHFVPSMLRQFLSDLAPGSALSLRHLFTSGEALPYDLMRETMQQMPTTKLHNLYGPTEAAIDVSFWDCVEREDRHVPIGRAIDGIELFILDEHARAVPDGDVGELHIAGIGLARGYLNREQLTAERFFEFVDGTGARRRVYKTGDRATVLDDGNIAYLGRLDFQVKLRGFRIELGEIEAALLDQASISEAVVLVDDSDAGDPRLVAHVVGESVESADVRKALKRVLPDYMVPNRFVSHAKLPLTAHGKVDRKALSQEKTAALARPDEGDLERRITSIVAQYLDGQMLGLDGDLFDHGATSFTLMRLSRELQQTLGVSLSLETFLQEPTIRGILNCCVNSPGAADPKPTAREQADSVSVDREIPPTPTSRNRESDHSIAVCLTQWDDAPADDSRRGASPRQESVGDQMSCEQAGPAIAADPAIAEADVKALVIEQCCKLLDIDGLGMEADLFDLGATSFTLMRLARTIDSEYQIAIPLEAFLDNPCVSGIVKAIMGLLPKASTPIATPTKPIATPTKPIATPTKKVTSELQPPESAAAPSIDGDGSSSGNSSSNKSRRMAIESCPGGYAGASLTAQSGAKALTLEQMGRLLSRIGAVRIGERNRYLFPSGGGKYPVQVYLEVGLDAVASLAPGAYYYHPEAHNLHMLEGYPSAPSAGVRLTLVAQLKALETTYNRLSPLLATLDAGYIIQLLSDAQAEEQVRVCPVRAVDTGTLRQRLCLEEGHHVLTCLSIGSEDGASGTGALKYLAAVAGSHPIVMNSYNERDYRFIPLSPEEKHQYDEGKLGLRKFREGETVTLPPRPYTMRDYVARGSRRDYARRAIEGRVFFDVIALVDAEVERLGQEADGAIPFSNLINIYVLIKANAIEGVDAGLWRYDRQSRELVFVDSHAYEPLRKGVYPFNRGHFDQAAFSLLMVAPKSTLENAEYLTQAVLGSGMLGQTIMWHQAAFNLGLCPIGWMHLQPVQEAGGLGADEVFIHGFTGGYFDHNQPLPLSALDQPIGPAWRAPDAPAPPRRDELAIIGISGRYPGACNLWQFWEILRAGNSKITPLPETRWQQPSLRGGFLSDVDRFDSLLFNIAPLEAKTMDPQERLFLEVVWECLESAGYTPERLRASAPRVGVFVGVMWGDYQKFGGSGGEPGPTSTYSSIPNRVSHFFDFRGPSLAVDTGCSSALTAVHLAAASLRNGECDAAVVGGVNVISHPDHIRVLSDLDLLSSDNKCHVFGDEGDGWVVGEGVGAMLLRPVEVAKTLGDLQYARIRGSSTAHRGYSRGRTMPNTDGQVAPLQTLFEQCGLQPADIDYVEASAAGSGIADAAEVRALERVFGKSGASYCLGSVKGNTGHMEAASGMAQLAKVILQMQYGNLVPTLVADTLNPFVDWNNAAGSLVTENQPWTKPASLVALINGYSAEGSSSHVLLESVAAPVRARIRESRELIVLSADSREQLLRYAARLAAHLRFCTETPAEQLPTLLRHPRLCDLAYTLQVGRVPMRCRFACTVHTFDEAIATLQQLADGESTLLNDVVEIDDAPCQRTKGVEPASVEDARRAWLEGYPVNWSQVLPGSPDVGILFLPTYPFADARYWLDGPSEPGDVSQQSSDQSDMNNRDEIVTELAQILCKIYAEEAQMPVSRVRANALLEGLGLSSLLITRFNDRLDKLGLGVQRRTLLFEYHTLHEVAEYLVLHHAPSVAQLLGRETQNASPANVGDSNQRPELVSDRSVSERTYESGLGETGIAVIGLAGHYPEAESVEALWENLVAGRNSVGEIPPERWDWHQHYNEIRGRSGFNYSRYGAFVKGATCFDPLFFKISPSEAETMDPQERLLLQTAWATVEDAGLPPQSLRNMGHVGVFVGVMNATYERAAADAASSNASARAQVTRYWSIPNRVSYLLDVQGPSMAVDTACSSSLTAIHLACESLRRGECSLALAGGVNLVLHPSHYISLSSVTMLSSGDECRPFGGNADGTVIGEGAGCVLLKPLRRAVADGDLIYGVILGSAINSDGRTNGYTVANPGAQGQVVAQALARAGVHPRTISYLEAHGTGTALGDPIEVEGLCQAFRAGTSDKQFCALGSIKSNIGHLESAAGVAGLTKVLLQMQHRRYVPTLHAEPCNPDIDFTHTPFRLQVEAADWPRPRLAIDGREPVNYPRRAGISSFGAGGVNVHMIVEEYMADKRAAFDPDTESANVIVLSAKRRERLCAMAERLRAHLLQHPEQALRDIAYTLQIGRQPMRFRLAFVVNDRAELIDALEQCAAENYDAIDACLGEVTVPGEKKTAAVGNASPDSLFKLAKQWAGGKTIDWQSLPVNRGARRLSLPSYPFCQQEYWIGGSPDLNTSAAVDNATDSNAEPINTPLLASAEKSDTHSNVTATTQRFDSGYAVPVQVRDDGPRRSGLPGTVWLIDRGDTVATALRQLTGHKVSVIVIKAGSSFKQGDDHFTVDPHNVADWQRLVDCLLAQNREPAAIINVCRQQRFDALAVDLEQQLSEGFYSWIYLSQSLSRAGHRRSTRCVSWLPNASDGGNPLFGAQESLLRTLSAEMSWLSAAVVECSDTAGQSIASLANELWGTGVDVIRYDGGERWRKSYQPLRVDENDETMLSGGVCIVAGGGGGIGRHIARYLLRQGAETIVLLGRSHDVDDRREQVHAMGERVFYRRVDISDVDGLKKVLDNVRKKFGAITGIVHCAGVLRNAAAADKQPLDMSAVLAPKVFGTVNLHRLTQKDPVECFILFSSLIAEIASPGQVDYAFGNGFMDHYANWREKERQAGRCHGRTLAIDWPFWRDGGMTMNEDMLNRLSERWGIDAIDSEWGLAALQQLWGCRRSHVLAIPGEPGKIEQTLGVSGKTNSLTPQSPASPAASGDIATLKADVAAVSKVDIELLDADTALVEYGFDSVMLTRLSLLISERLGIELTPSDLVENPTLVQLQSFIEKALWAIEENRADQVVVGGDTLVSRLRSSAAGRGFDQPGVPGNKTVPRSASNPLLGDTGRFRNGSRGRVHLHANAAVLDHHRVEGKVLLPGAGYIEMARAGACEVLGCDTIEVTNVSWLQPLGLDDGGSAEIELCFDQRDHRCAFRFMSSNGHVTYAQGNVAPLQRQPEVRRLDLKALRQRCPRVRKKEQLYHAFRETGLDYGTLYRGIEWLCEGKGEALSRIVLNGEKGSTAGFALHPALLDCAFQSAIGATDSDQSLGRLQLPFFVKSVRQFSTLPGECWVHVCRASNSSARVERFNIRVCDARGNVCAEIDEFTVRPVEAKEGDSGQREADRPLPNRQPRQNGGKDSSRGARPRRQVPIAVIGVSGRFPQSPDVETYWRHIREGKDMISEVTPDRWNWREVFASQKGLVGKTYSRWAGFMADVYHYDPAFFHVREQDAKAMDLQHLLMLELSQQLFDCAGYRASELAGSNTAVILGAAADDCPATMDKSISADVAKAAIVHSIQNMIAARISDFYDFRGEAFTMDTACSSSLAATHNACRILRAGECDMAIAGGVTLLLDKFAHVRFSQASVLSDEPHSYIFDKRAKGFVLGEGAGLVLLKRYDDAVADGDNILGVIRGSAINNDGRTMGITTPNFKMQRAVIRQAIDNAGVDPATIGYLEAHGTGTLLGDPIEIKAATQAYRDFTQQRQYCAVGSVKSNMGHTLLAAGVASLIKVIMMLQHRYIPRTLHCDTPHPRFEFERSPFRPALRGESWETRDEPRRAAISGFGFGGTNCHMILEEFVPAETGYQQKRSPLPATQFNRVHCRPAKAPLQSLTQEEGPEQTVPKTLEPSPQTYEDIIEALQQGRISVQEAVAMESVLTETM
ncbi:MAG: amino acid adenylation domain-containing protein [Exilibacterium sp.]